MVTGSRDAVVRVDAQVDQHRDVVGQEGRVAEHDAPSLDGTQRSLAGGRIEFCRLDKPNAARLRCG